MRNTNEYAANFPVRLDAMAFFDVVVHVSHPLSTRFTCIIIHLTVYTG
jgi:hypothetical protein